MLALATTDRAFAQTTTVEFNIPAQTVPAALNDFARQARVQLFFITDGFEDVQANAVVGTYDRQEALTRLLAGTGLQASLSPNSGIKVGPVSTSMNSLVVGSQLLAAVGAVATEDMTGGGYSGEQSNEDVRQSGRDREQQDAEEAAREVEEILVTGSRIRGAQSASPLVTISRQQIDQAGFATVGELVDKLPQNFGAGASLDTVREPGINLSNTVGGSVDNLAGGTSINLRGLGASSTLVLLNGRRMSPAGRSARFTNISSIPVTAIERVEVLTDGASAIYGSDAIGGVVNFILRDDYEGAETRLRYGSDTGGDISTTLFGQSFGNSWQGGNFLLAYEYYSSDNLANSDREFTSTSDLSRFGGTDFRIPGGNPANIFANGQTFAIPAGQDGTSLTAADFNVNAPQNIYNPRSIGDLLPDQERHSAFFYLAQDIGPIELFAEARFSSSESESFDNGFTVDIDVPDSNPFFVDPTDSGLTTVTVEGYALNEDIGRSQEFGDVDTLGVALGARFDLAENWSGELLGHWSTEDATLRESLRITNIDQAALAAAASQSDPSLAFNPFGDGSNTNVAIIETFVDRTPRVANDSENELWSVNLNVNGELFDIAGGAVQLAAGVEFREDSLFSINDPAEGGIGSDSSRDVLAVYSEIFFPLVSESNSRSGLRRLEVSLAGRYEDYSDFGDTINPKIGLVWSPAQSLSLRGTYGTSYRAPALFDLDITSSANGATYIGQLLVDLGLIPFPLLARFGGNENLEPEEATTWTAGFEWNPERIDGLSLDVTYFNVDFDDRIEQPTTSILTAINDPRFSSIFNIAPTPEEIVAVVTDPRFQELSFGNFTPVTDFLSGALPVGGIVDIRKQNLSQSVVTGIDVQLLYSFETEVGLFDVGLNSSYLLDFERRFIDTDPLVDEVDTYGRPVDFQARGNVTWRRDSWSVSGFVNHMDGYTDNINDPARSVDSYTTVDLTITYDSGRSGVDGIFGNMTVSLITQNLFDEDPPFVNTLGGIGYDSANGDPRGRFVAIQISKDW